MNIIVCVKQVPGTNKVEVDPVTGVLKRDGVESKLNPYDLFAIEAAIRLKEQTSGTVTALSMGPNQAIPSLYETIYMGADRGVLLSDRKFAGADVQATSYALAAGVRKIGNYDLIICGKQTTDGDTAQTGPAVAGWLGVPQVTIASSLAVEDGWVVCDRKLGKMRQRVKAKMPCAVCVTGDINKPRYPTAMNVMKANKKPLAVWNAADLGADTTKTGNAGSPSSNKGIFAPEKRSTDTKYFSGEMADIVRELADALEAEHLI